MLEFVFLPAVPADAVVGSKPKDPGTALEDRQNKVVAQTLRIRRLILIHLETVPLVVLANVASLSTDDAGQLSQFVNQGGGLLVFTGDNVRADGYRWLSATGLSVGEIIGPATAGDLPWRFESWDEKHPVFYPFNDPEYGDLRRVAFRTYTRIRPTEQARVLARFRGGDPAILEREHGRGKVLWFVSACNRDWSDWPRSRLYVPLVHQMLGYLAGLAGGGVVLDVLIDQLDSDVNQPVPGVFNRGRFWEVVNVNPRESETDRCTSEEFANRFQLQLYEEQQGQLSVAASELIAGLDLREDEIWPWVLFPLLAVLLLENFIANRTVA